MTRAFVSVVFLFLNFVSSDLKKMREQFSLMSKSEESIVKIKELAIKSKEVSSVLKQAYYAAAEMSSAQYKKNPAAKINAFNTGKKTLESAIKADTTNIETRYIRYTIQQNAPSFLGYSKNLVADKFFLLNNLSAIKKKDSELFSNVYAYLLTYGKLTEQEKTLMLR